MGLQEHRPAHLDASLMQTTPSTFIERLNEDGTVGDQVDIGKILLENGLFSGTFRTVVLHVLHIIIDSVSG